MNTNEEIYVMPSFPMLAVEDLAAAARWYQDTLGFSHVFTIPGAGGQAQLVHLRWAKYADLLLVNSPQPSAGPKGVGVTLNFQMAASNRDVDQLAHQARSNNANIVDGPTNKPWNARELTILDPDGYRLTFTQVISSDMAMDIVLDHIEAGAD